MNMIKALENVKRSLPLNPQGGYTFISATDKGENEAITVHPASVEFTNMWGVSVSMEEARQVVTSIKEMIEGLSVLPNLVTWSASNGIHLSYLYLENAQAAFPNLYFRRQENGEITSEITSGLTITAII